MASYQSSATFYEVCFNHFFRARTEKDGGDLVYFRSHLRAYMHVRSEGRLTEEQMDNFRRSSRQGSVLLSAPETDAGILAVPDRIHGSGAVGRYLSGQIPEISGTPRSERHLRTNRLRLPGDGEMDEPESKGAITIATRENWTTVFVINCNLQRLDGPVTGNGKIINELEGIFGGAGWNVIKVIWGGRWDELLRKDTSGKLIQLMNETVDGDYQTFKSKDGAYVREHFFGKYPETAARSLTGLTSRSGL